MNVTFDCPDCDSSFSASADQPGDWQCPSCAHHLHLPAADAALSTCIVCGNHELYKKKDFPHRLGMAILIGAILLSTVAYYGYEKWWWWAILIGSAIVDGGLYLVVGDVVVCYRCEAHYRGLTPTDAHQPFEIAIGERYRQEKIRRQQMKNQGG